MGAGPAPRCASGGSGRLATDDLLAGPPGGTGWFAAAGVRRPALAAPHRAAIPPFAVGPRPPLGGARPADGGGAAPGASIFGGDGADAPRWRSVAGRRSRGQLARVV